MSATDGLLANNERYAGAFAGPVPGRPSLGVAVDEDLRKSIARVKACPFLNHTHEVRGFVFDVATGRLREVR